LKTELTLIGGRVSEFGSSAEAAARDLKEGDSVGEVGRGTAEVGES
jgi:hypothetical protein